MVNKNRIPGIITILFALIVIIISFTPIVIPKGIHEPKLLSLPYSLWMGILMTVLLVALTWVSTRVHPKAKEAIKKEKQLKAESND